MVPPINVDAAWVRPSPGNDSTSAETDLGEMGGPSAPKRNGGRHCCRPPLSLVPLVLPEGETAFPREVPAEALRPRSVPQVPRSGNIAIPVRVPAGSAPRLAAGFGSLAGSVRLRLATSTVGSLSVVRRGEPHRSSFRGSFRPGASGSAGPSKESGFGLGLRRRLALLPSGCPDLASFGFRPFERPPLSARPPLGPSLPFPEKGRFPATRGHWHRSSSRA
jgi:hypothetical protein